MSHTNTHDKQSVSSITKIRGKIKVVFLGEQSTGKTSILMRFLNGKFEQTQGPTVGIDFMGKNYSVGNTHLRLQLWDTAGQQRFRSLIPSYLKDAVVTLIVFDLTSNILKYKLDQRSIDNLGEWIDLCQNNRNNDKNILIFLGNKSDLYDLREINQEQIDSKLGQFFNGNVKYFEVSAKSGKNIDQVFNYACQQYVKNNISESELSFSHVNEQMKKRFNNSDKKQKDQFQVTNFQNKSSKFKKFQKTDSKKRDPQKLPDNIRLSGTTRNTRSKSSKCCW